MRFSYKPTAITYWYNNANFRSIPPLVALLYIVAYLYRSVFPDGNYSNFSAIEHRDSLPSSVSAWYGISAYPKIAGTNESWDWVMHFVNSVSHEPWPNNSVLNAGNSANLRSVRFPAVKTVEFETAFLQQHLGLRRWSTKISVIPRYDCGYPKCLAKRKKLILRPDNMPVIDENTVVIHGLITDTYDIKRILDSLAPSTMILVTGITVYGKLKSILDIDRSRPKEKEENFALQLYDFLHHVYFHFNWIPMSSVQFDCDNLKLRVVQGCQIWITWKSWNNDRRLVYFPPAGTGPPEMELQRLSSFINHPQRDACSVIQKIGGFRKSGSFIDGQYAICLDRLRPALVSGTCLVYSFGVSVDWTFDEQILEAGCEVHSFDPSIRIPSHKRAPGHWFWAWGLNSVVTPEPGWDMASYQQTRERLKHNGRRISVLKMDVEGAEWTFIREAMGDPTILDSIDQFILEIHPLTRVGSWMNVIRQRSMMLHYLEKRGFVLFNTRQNVIGLDLRSLNYDVKLGPKTGNFLYELSFLNVKRQVTE